MTNVYEAINAVTAEMALEGIAKGRKNQQQGYSFRGIDDVYAALSSKLAQHKLCVLPRVISREVTDRKSSKGNDLIYTTLCVEFDFVSAVDGSKHTVCTVGEAMDSADKSSNKAMSAAYKYAAIMTFCIPIEGDNDADATTHELAPRNEPKPASKADARPQYAALEKSMRANKTTAELAAWWRDPECKSAREKLPADWQKNLHEQFSEYGFELKAKEQKGGVDDDSQFPGSTSATNLANHPLAAG